MHRAQDVLMLVDREEISRRLAESLEYKEIGLRLGRDSSVISREVAPARRPQGLPGGGRAHRGVCRAGAAQAVRPGWSPASIAGRLPTEYAADESYRVSHEAIYQWVYARPVSTLAQELIRLRTARTARKGGRRPPPAPRIREPVSIDDRPAEVEGRQVPGHGEGDMIIGKTNGVDLLTAAPPAGRSPPERRRAVQYPRRSRVQEIGHGRR
jgi:IS30 family transposase